MACAPLGKDYTKEMREPGYIGRGEVEVLDR